MIGLGSPTRPHSFVYRRRTIGTHVVFWTFCAALYYIFTSLHKVHHIGRARKDLSLEERTGIPPANATLGFGSILAVSTESSPRKESLVFAANLTEIDITIPHQPVWTDEDVANIQSRRASKLTRGSALAWLGHLNALRWFLKSGKETALILEDDVDWDIHIRTMQVPKTASALRKLLDSNETYWSDLKKWEILYIGHCGDYFPASTIAMGLPYAIFEDDSLPAIEDMHPHTQSFLGNIGVRDKLRMVHPSRWPLCTFAYAVTRDSATRILLEFGTEEEDHGTPAYDVRILEACRDLGWKCFSANPELFHHISENTSEIKNINHDPEYKQSEKASPNDKTIKSGAPNIACGARSEGFFTKDPRTFDFLKNMINFHGYCLLDWIRMERR